MRTGFFKRDENGVVGFVDDPCGVWYVTDDPKIPEGAQNKGNDITITLDASSHWSNGRLKKQKDDDEAPL